MSRLVEEGLPAVACSPFGAWETNGGIVSKHNIPALKDMLNAGLIPVLHGDVVLYVMISCFLSLIITPEMSRKAVQY